MDLRLACLLAIGLLVFIASKNTRLSYEHSWMEGHYLTMGRATATLGLFNTGALPIENNALTAPWDTYLDWPPLSVYMLAAAYQVFGDNPLPYHLLFVLFQAMSAWMIGSILRELGYRVGAWFGATVFLSAPVIVNYGFVAGPPAVAEMLFLMAIRLFVGWAKGRWPLWPAPLSAFMATCASWEPLFGFASLLLAFLPRDRRNLLSGAVLVASAGFSGCLAVLLLFAVQDPAFASKLVARGLLRAGIGSGQLPHFDVWMIEMLREPRYGLDFVLSQGLRRTMTGLGPVGLMGVATAVLTPWIGRPRGTAPNLLTPVLLAFAGYWILWAVVMNNQYSAHHFMTMIALPFAALGSGLLGELLLPKVRMAATVLAIVTAVAVAATGSEKPSGIHLVELGQLIDASLPRDAVVITSQRSGVPLYYSHRIVVRSLDTDAWIADHRDEFRAICRSCPVYLAISDSETVNFQRVIQGKQRVAEQAPWGIYWIAGPEDPVWGSRQAAMAAPQAGAQGTP